MGLEGKWIWVWNWRRCDGGDARRVAARLKATGCRGAIVKAHDGPRWFDQGRAWREIAGALKAEGVGVGGWGYCYGDDPAAEAELAVLTVREGKADFFVLDAEGELKGRPQAAASLCHRLRDALGARYPLYFSSFAIPRLHETFPFEVFARYCRGAAPQVYWNAFGWPVGEALSAAYDGYSALGLPPARLFPVAGLYQEGEVPYPSAESVAGFADAAAARGSRGVSFWSYEHMNAAMWEAVAAVRLPRGGPKVPTYENLLSRVKSLEKRVGAIERALALRPAKPAGRVYTVRAGDTLSAIAERFGLTWQALHEANRGTIGPDPNVIVPGQVLRLPE